MKKYLSFFILCFFLNSANVLAQALPIAHLSVDLLSIEENGGVSKLTISLKDASDFDPILTTTSLFDKPTTVASINSFSSTEDRLSV